MKDKRIIFHIDLDCFYASVEIQKNPALKGLPVAVAGDVEKRHGIILAKSYEAKKYGIKTGEALWQAKEKCCDLILVPADFHAYQCYSNLVRNIYFQYTDKVEAFGLDENWLDVTSTLHLFGDDPYLLAKKIQIEVLEKTGLTCSIGIGWNKIVAKFGSDKKKPFGITYIHELNYRNIFWNSPVEDLLYVGRKTKEKMNKWGIYTIGDLAMDRNNLVAKYGGKIGRMLIMWAKGYDSTLVGCLYEPERACKSVGNSITTCKDIVGFEDAKIVFQVLCESVATRLKELKMEGDVICINVRNSKLHSFSKQHKLSTRTNISSVILSEVLRILQESYDFQSPLRSIGVSVSHLSFQNESYIQYDLFDDVNEREKERAVDVVMDRIREKFGYESIKKCSILLDRELTGFNPLSHTVHPIGYLK